MSEDGDRLGRARAWWSTGLIDIHPGQIAIRGYPIETLIGHTGFAQMIWLMLRGEKPLPGQSELLEAALVASVDHGPHAPSIAIARMAATCGVGLNGAMASAINVLGDVHGGAGQLCMELYEDALRRVKAGEDWASAAQSAIDAHVAEHGKVVAGFGHRFHPVDPRVAPLLGLVESARERGVVRGDHARMAREVEAALQRRTGKPLPMNIDGVTAAIFGELGFAPPLGRGIFILSRSVGILAHAWEQMQRGERIKGPMPKDIPYTYTGPSTGSRSET